VATIIRSMFATRQKDGAEGCKCFVPQVSRTFVLVAMSDPENLQGRHAASALPEFSC
jgi:hypothetical protein